MALEELIREAAKKGLTHLTLYPVPSDDHKKVYWNARATPSTGHQYVSAANVDPIVALTTVLENLPKAKTRAQPRFDSVNPPTSEIAQRDLGITATVTESDASPGAAELPPELESEIDKWLPKT